jgi:hypothetical protein
VAGATAIVRLPEGERPPLKRQPRVSWPSLIDYHVHPVQVAVVEAMRWIGGPLSARELWLVEVGEPAYQNVAYHVRVLVDLGLMEQTHKSAARGSEEKFYVLSRAA